MFGIGPSSNQLGNTGGSQNGFLDPNRFNKRPPFQFPSNTGQPSIGPSNDYKINPMPRMGQPTGPNGEPLLTTMPIGNKIQMPLDPGMGTTMPIGPGRQLPGFQMPEDINGGNSRIDFASMLRRIYGGGQ